MGCLSRTNRKPCRRLRVYPTAPAVLLAGVLAACTPEGPPLLPEPDSLRLRADGMVLRDGLGREVRLHGINVGGAAKLPARPLRTSEHPDFLAGDVQSFVGHPLPLAEADAHFARLAAWGFNFIRLLVTWEGIAHAGPGAIDTAYLDYVRVLAERAGAHGLRVLVDMHQDVWSRFSGGSGAPAWTLEAAGFDLDALHETGAAVLHSEAAPGAYVHLQWPTNHTRLATATMFTLFFASEAFAPQAEAGGVPLGRWLRGHYIDAFVALATRLADVDAVIGYDLMNEPGFGLIGLESLAHWETLLTLGPMPTPAQALFAAEFPQTVTNWRFDGLGFVPEGELLLNPAGRRVWQEGAADPWREAGVWDVVDGVPRVLRDAHFARVAGRPVEPVRDFLEPFYAELGAALQTAHPGSLLFVEAPQESPDVPRLPPALMPFAVYAPHWYDGLVMVTRQFNPDLGVRVEPELELVVGRQRVRDLVAELLGELRARGDAAGVPTVVGEFGLPLRPEDAPGYELATEALDVYYAGMEAHGLGSALWNYNPFNTHAVGDGWNLEDFSVIGLDDPDGRALGGFVRPRLLTLAGRRAETRWDRETRRFELRYQSETADRSRATWLAVPRHLWPDGPQPVIEGARTCPAPPGRLCLQAEAAEVRVRWE